MTARVALYIYIYFNFKKLYQNRQVQQLIQCFKFYLHVLIYLHDIQVDWCKHELIQYNIFYKKAIKFHSYNQKYLLFYQK